VLLIGQQALAMTTFLTVLAMFLLPSPARLAATAVIVAATATAVLTVPGWGHDLGVLLGLVLTALVMWGVIQMIERNAELARAQERLAELAVTEERARFARDLHDVLGHSLTLLAIKAELAGRLVRLDADRAEREIAEVERLARDALVDVRAAVGGYRQATLSGELISARAVLDAAGIDAELPVAVDEVTGERRELLGWAVREGVTNVVRHSGATRCRIRVTSDGVEIMDDGRGPGPAPAGGAEGWTLGSGLRGLRERAEAAGATVVIGSSPDGGFRLRVGW
jgi:two-component system, NarL family, sensor histidine kinase DesK